ncbi:hypothetical protein B6U99_07315, partial [Candidatus Geothermarchaeota archaeon ex4572_27]
CFDPSTWLCKACHSSPAMRREEVVAAPQLPIAMLALGMIMVVVGMALMALAPLMLGGGTAMGGSTVIIWPFPLPIIGFTSDQAWPAILAVLGFLALFALIAFKALRPLA